MELIDQTAADYASRHSSPLDYLLAEIERKTLTVHPHAHILSGHVQGKLLEMISCMLQPLRILEIGTFTGFSSLCLVKGLTQDGLLHTIEIREEDANTAEKYFEQAGEKKRIRLHRGNALEIIPELEEVWDLVFIDADKVNYINYYELTLPYVKRGGWILADNVLFHGKVLKENITGRNATAIHAFNEHIIKDGRVHQVMLTVRDGLLLIQKR